MTCVKCLQQQHQKRLILPSATSRIWRSPVARTEAPWFRRFSEPGLPSSWGPRAMIVLTCVTKNEWNDRLHCRVHTRFTYITGEIIWEHKRHQNSWRLGLTGAAYGSFSGPLDGGTGTRWPIPKLHTPLLAFRASGSAALRASQLRAPNLLLNQGPSEPCYTTGAVMGALLRSHRIIVRPVDQQNDDRIVDNNPQTATDCQIDGLHSFGTVNTEYTIIVLILPMLSNLSRDM